MTIAYELLLLTHGVAGIVALLLFWIPALSRKGSPLHRKAGKAYVWVMSVTVLTAWPLALKLGLQGQAVLALFLAYLAVLTATTVWNGWRAPRAKRDFRRYTHAGHAAAGAANLLGGLAMAILGMMYDTMLLLAFAPVGMGIGMAMLLQWRRPPDEPRAWLYEHFGGMIGSGIAAHVAFFAVGARSLLELGTSGYGVLLWVAPVVVGTAAISWLNVHYRRPATPAP